MYRLFAGFILSIVFCALAFGQQPPPRLEISAPTASFDGIFHGRYPHGDAPGVNTCPVTVGTLTLTLIASPRTTGVSPFIVFYDATATTDTATLAGANNAFQDIYYSWDFGDSGASGTGTWATGSNAGHNSLNVAYGAVAAHMYVTAGADTSYTATVSAFDGTNLAVCKAPPVTAYDPSGSSGFPGTATICASSTVTPVAGSSGCPAGAAVVNSASFNTAAAGLANGKRILFKCGDTFTGNNLSITQTKVTIGAYGGCEGTAVNRPILTLTSAPNIFTMGIHSVDVRVMDLVLDANNLANSVLMDSGSPLCTSIPIEWTLYNLDAKGNQYQAYVWGAGKEMSIVDSVAETITAAVKHINVFPNYSGTNFNCTTPNEDYGFFAGNNFFNSTGTNSTSDEVFRDSYASKQIISNNTMSNAGTSTGFAIIKFHDLNFATDCMGVFPTCGGWSGLFTQYDIISDNFLFGSSGAQCLEVTPQNAQSDERMRFIIIERNLLKCTEAFGRQALLSGVNMTFRDNTLVSVPANGTTNSNAAVQVAQRGIEPAPQGVEVYNNTCTSLTASPTNGLACILVNNSGNAGTAVATNSFVQNNLIFNSNPTVTNSSGTNTVGNNTSNATLNPSFTNASGSFLLMSDFKPTANFSGGTTVPNWFDALNASWSPTRDLGAVQH